MNYNQKTIIIENAWCAEVLRADGADEHTIAAFAQPCDGCSFCRSLPVPEPETEMAMETKTETETIAQELAYLFTRRSLMECRGLHPVTRGVVSGYFDDPSQMAAQAQYWNQVGYQIYYMLNHIVGKSVTGTMVPATKTTSRQSIEKRLTFFVDLDPVRTTGTSSTEDELDATKAVAEQVVTYLASGGFPEPQMVMSGNGIQLLYDCDIPSNEAMDGLFKACLLALHRRFSSPQVTVDTAVHDPARICKLPGTMARKGVSTADRPHRRAYTMRHPANREQVSVRALQWLAQNTPTPEEQTPALSKFNTPLPAREPRESAEGVESWDEEMLLEWLQEQNITPRYKKEVGGKTIWHLPVCPFHCVHQGGNHNKGTNHAFVQIDETGQLGAGCFRPDCQIFIDSPAVNGERIPALLPFAGHGWRMLRAILDTAYRERQEAYEKKVKTEITMQTILEQTRAAANMGQALEVTECAVRPLEEAPLEITAVEVLGKSNLAQLIQQEDAFVQLLQEEEHFRYQEMVEYTDAGNAQRLLRNYGTDVLYIDSRGFGWLVWTGTQWEMNSNRVHNMATETAVKITDEVAKLANAEEGTPERERYEAGMTWSKASQSETRLKAMMNLASKESRILRKHTDFDADPYLLGVKNGVVDLRTGELLYPQREQLITKRSPQNYIPCAGCPRWLEFLNQIFSGDHEMIRYLQWFFGYSLI